MNNQPPSHITLPLETLFGYLEAAGFEVSPACRVRAWRVLEGLGREKNLRNIAGLKTYLAPVFVRNAVEQERFYAIFDRFAQDLAATDPDVDLMDAPAPERTVKALRIGKYGSWIWKILLASAILAGGVFLKKIFFPARIEYPKPNFDVVRMENGKPVVLNGDGPTGSIPLYDGDTILLFNTTFFQPNQDTSEYFFEWETRISRVSKPSVIFRPGSQPDDILTASYWQTVIRLPSYTDEPVFCLKMVHKKSGFTDTEYKDVSAKCRVSPILPNLRVPETAKIDERVSFSIVGKPNPSLKYSWNISNGALQYNENIDGPAATLRFDTQGVYEIWFQVVDTIHQQYCTSDTSLFIRVGDEQLNLPYKSLQADNIQPVAVFGWLAYLLLALLALCVFWTWMKWAARKRPGPDKPRPDIVAVPHRSTTDKPPYYIPFREQKGVLRTAREQFRFGDALRLRQEGQHRVLDIPETLRATLDQGGYPILRYRYQTKPTDYLFLVDEQLPGNHLARLFRHLAENLRRQDVALELFWYDYDFARFWNRDMPEGVSLEGLRRLFPEHRLVLLGTGLALTDPFSEQTPRMRPNLATALKGWRERLLFTPVPPHSWNWREGVIFRLFPLFPADLRGLNDAAQFIEAGLDSEDLPASFWTWQQRQQDIRHPDADLNYRNWRTAGDHEDYLSAWSPDLLRWFRALAITPSPVWETSLAIARALDITVNHDGLLALARIPTLQKGEWHPRLRREMLSTLDPDDERLARIAIQEELEAVREESKNSHAAPELESNLAIQQFILDTSDAANRTLVLALLDAGLLSKRQEEELNFVVNREEEKKYELKNEGIKTTFREWAESQQPAIPDPPPPKKPVFSNLHKAIVLGWCYLVVFKNILLVSLAVAISLLVIEEDRKRPPRRKKSSRPFPTLAVTLSVFYMLLLLIGWSYSGTAELRKMVFGKDEAFTPGRDTLRDIIWVKEDWVVDSAVIYNNLGVANSKPVKVESDTTFTDTGMTWFEKAMGYRYPNPYLLAQQNSIRAWYNISSAALRNNPANLQKLAIPWFWYTGELAKNDFPSEKLDAWHGLGVAYFYAGMRDSAAFYYGQIKNEGYFDTLTLRPNLETLLGFAQSRIVAVETRARPDSTVQSSVTYQIGRKLAQNPLLVVSITDNSGKTIADGQKILKRTKPGQYQDLLLLPLKERGNPVRAEILIVRLYDNTQRNAVLAERTVPLNLNWSPSATAPSSPATGNPGATDSDADGIPDSADGCPTDPNKIVPGACDCGVPDTDTDGDGIADCIDKCPDISGDKKNSGCPTQDLSTGTGGFSSSLGDFSIPSFLFPPPRPSNFYTISDSLFSKCRTLGDVERQLASALNSTGYPHSYFVVPNGFAIVTQLEQFDENGNSMVGASRWNENPEGNSSNLSEYLKSLFFNKEGYFRVFVFIISDKPFSFSDRQTTLETDSSRMLQSKEPTRWISMGASRLPATLFKIKFSENYNVNTLVYEYKVSPSNKSAILNSPGMFNGATHLKKSGIIDALRK